MKRLIHEILWDLVILAAVAAVVVFAAVNR